VCRDLCSGEQDLSANLTWIMITETGMQLHYYGWDGWGHCFEVRRKVYLTLVPPLSGPLLEASRQAPLKAPRENEKSDD